MLGCEERLEDLFLQGEKLRIEEDMMGRPTDATLRSVNQSPLLSRASAEHSGMVLPVPSRSHWHSG